MLALQFATATANLASKKSAFLFLATHGPLAIFIASSSSGQVTQAGSLESEGCAVSGSVPHRSILE